MIPRLLGSVCHLLRTTGLLEVSIHCASLEVSHLNFHSWLGWNKATSWAQFVSLPPRLAGFQVSATRILESLETLDFFSQIQSVAKFTKKYHSYHVHSFSLNLNPCTCYHENAHVLSNKEQPMQLLQSILGRLKSRYEVSAQKVSVCYFHESSICQVANSFIRSTTFNSGNCSEKLTQSSQMGTISSQGVLIWILRANKQLVYWHCSKVLWKTEAALVQPWAPFAGEIHPSQHQTPMRGRPGTALVLEWSLYVMSHAFSFTGFVDYTFRLFFSRIHTGSQVLQDALVFFSRVKPNRARGVNSSTKINRWCLCKSNVNHYW